MPRKQNAKKNRATSNGTRQQTSSRTVPGQKRPAADSNSSATKRPKRTAQTPRSPRPLTTDDLPTLIREVCSNLSKDAGESSQEDGGRRRTTRQNEPGRTSDVRQALPRSREDNTRRSRRDSAASTHDSEDDDSVLTDDGKHNFNPYLSLRTKRLVADLFLIKLILHLNAAIIQLASAAILSAAGRSNGPTINCYCRLVMWSPLCTS